MNDLAVIDEHHTVTLVRDLPGPIDRVWAFLTKPEHITKWLSDAIVDGRVGGEIRFKMGAHGRITLFESPRLLEYTWNEPELSRGAVLDTLVRWELVELGDRVRLTLTHTRLSASEAVLHAAGWHALVEGLSACLDGNVPLDVRERMTALRELYSERYSAAS